MKGLKKNNKRDLYYRKAKDLGFRARSAFKLIQLDDEFNLFEGVDRVVDLCAAPGSWSQVLSRRIVGEGGFNAEEGKPTPIVAVDLQEMAEIEGVTCYQGDITSEETINTIVHHFSDIDEEMTDINSSSSSSTGGVVDLVISDGAPDVSGLHDLDEFLQTQLLQAAITITLRLLKPGGRFVAKVFCTERQLEEDDFLLLDLYRVLFSRVVLWKPHSSRSSSAEHFLVAFDFHPERAEREEIQAFLRSGGCLC